MSLFFHSETRNKCVAQEVPGWTRRILSMALVLLALLLVCVGCSEASEGATIIRGALRKKKTPGTVQFEMKMSAGKGGNYQSFVVEGATNYAQDKPLTHMAVTVHVDESQTQQLEYYLEYTAQGVQVYERSSNRWGRKSLSRSTAQHMYNGLRYDISKELVKSMKTTVLDGEMQQVGELCSRVSGEIPVAQFETIFGETLLPDFFGIDAGEVAIYDEVGSIPATVYIGVNDDRIYRLTLKLDPALLPMVKMTAERKSKAGSMSELWTDVSVAYCQLDLRFFGYDDPLELRVPEEARDAGFSGVELPAAEVESEAPEEDGAIE